MPGNDGCPGQPGHGPPDAQSRPGGGGSDTQRLASGFGDLTLDRGPDEDHDARRPAIHEDGPWIVAEAESIIGLEVLALAALSQLTTEQLRGLVWIGLVDDGWRRLLAELHARGESL